MTFRSMTAAVALMALAAVGLARPAAAADDYVWVDACKGCHAAQYAAWEKTKHAHAINRLSGDERTSGKCVRCHITEGTELAAGDANANIQCEACHGAGRAHVAAAAGPGKPAAITRKPAERVCVQCHNDTSPHFKFFSYDALAPLVHTTK